MPPRPSSRLPILAILLLAACTADERQSTEDLSSVATDGMAASSPSPDFALSDGIGVPREKLEESVAQQGGAPPGGPRSGVGSFGIGSAQAPFPAPGVESVAPVMLVRAGHAILEVRDLDPAVTSLRQLVLAHAGYVATTTVQAGRDQRRSATVEAKVPSERFDAFVSGLSPLGKIETVNVSASDVGEEFSDLAARLENARRLESRLLALLANRTGKLEEVLSVERELARVREQVERIEGRMRYLSARSAMSTLAVTLHEPLPIVGGPAGRNPIAEAVRLAWRNLVAVIALGIAALGVVLPVAAILGVAWWGARRVRQWSAVRPT